MVSKPTKLVSLDKERHMRLDPNAVADAEQVLGMGLAGILQQDMMGVRFIRAFMWAGLRWEERGLTQEQVGDIIFEYCASGKGTMEDLAIMVTQALAEAGWFKMKAKTGGAEPGN